MRQKFGASNGLRAGGGGGGMQGIGSDPNYRPGEGGSGRGGGAPDINEIGANAFSFVSSWADTITKVSSVRQGAVPIVALLQHMKVILWYFFLNCVRRRRSSWYRRRRRTRTAQPTAPPTAAATAAAAARARPAAVMVRRRIPGQPSPQVRCCRQSLLLVSWFCCCPARVDVGVGITSVLYALLC
jgi:hypothetical protein